MKPIRVLVVDDSLTVRKRLVEVLSSDPQFEVVGEAVDGQTAFDACRALLPDVITLDMMLPVMTGLAATEQIMGNCPTPILIVSSSINRGDLFKTYQALAAGAVDVLEKPFGDERDADWEDRFRGAVRMVSRIKVITHPRARLRELQEAGGKRAAVHLPGPSAGRRPVSAVAMGASTGGPGAVVAVLRAIPADFPLPIFLVLHIGEPFGAAFAEWLDGQSPHRVSFARGGESVSSVAGRVIMAPPDRHLILENGTLRLTHSPERHSCRPSVDVLFESVARELGASAAACLLTGMGRDGAAGLLAIRQSGGLTIAQDEASCVVYGMPREAVALGAAEHILPLGEIGPMFSSLAVSEPGGVR